MNKPKVTEYDYIDFLIGTQKIYSCTEAERVQPDETDGPSHNAFTRQLHRLFPTVERLRSEVRDHVDLTKGCLIRDDSTLDKFYSRRIEPVTRHRSGKHKRVVSGIKGSGKAESAIRTGGFGGRKAEAAGRTGCLLRCGINDSPGCG